LRTISGGPAILRGSVLGLAADDFAGLWIVTAGHVMRADRDALLDGRIGVDDVREFGAADGLVDTEVIKRHRILTADPRGRVWLATNRGLLMADSRRLAAGGAPALVQVEEILADGSPVTLEQSITIPPGPDRLT